MPILPPNQHRQSTEGKCTEGNLFPVNKIKILHFSSILATAVGTVYISEYHVNYQYYLLQKTVHYKYNLTLLLQPEV